MADNITPSVQQHEYVLNGSDLSCDALVNILCQKQPVQVREDCWENVQRQRAIVTEIVRRGIPAYGVTTGVGSQKGYVVSEEDAADYNMRLVRAHATRVPGPVIPKEIVRAVLVILINEFAQGHSGVSQDLLTTLVEACNYEKMPEIDASGSVGASDLVPLAQLAVWLLSLEKAKERGLPRAKEALSLINHNAVTLAHGAFAIVELKKLLALYDLTAAVTLEGFRGNLSALSEAVNRVHHRPGQRTVAARIRAHLHGSKLWSEGEARFLQDPLSFRAMSQIHGAMAETAERSEEIWNQELNTVNDNPIIDPETGGPNSHANMDSTRLTLTLDTLRQAVAKLGDLSGERIQKLQWPTFSGLPAGLAEGDGHAVGGVQFLNLGHIAASLATSLKIWARPHLLISVGQVADGVEDTSGHAFHAVHDLNRQLETSWKVVAIELSIAIWAIQRRGIPTSQLGVGVRKAYEKICPLLPIRNEGEEQFNLAVVIDAAKSLIEDDDF